MPQSFDSSRPKAHVNVIGAGIAGTWQALLFAQAGYAVTVHERDREDLARATSRRAGGMLAPYCEQDTGEPIITRLGVRSLGLWREQHPHTTFNGSLVVAHPRDRGDLEHFARVTPGHARLNANEIAALEPSLAGRFREGLFYPEEGHVEPRKALTALHARLAAQGIAIRYGSEPAADDLDGIVIDCRGLAARDTKTAKSCGTLRGVKGETVVIETGEIALSRPVRLIHPRWPLYIIPRADHRFMIGATSIESEDDGVSVRSALELLTAAYAVHPAFAEARIVEFGSGLRPAFPDNLPQIAIEGSRISVNGLYRHGFLIAPALAEMTVAYVARGQIDNEVMRCA